MLHHPQDGRERANQLANALAPHEIFDQHSSLLLLSPPTALLPRRSHGCRAKGPEQLILNEAGATPDICAYITSRGINSSGQLALVASSVDELLIQLLFQTVQRWRRQIGH